jgi:hypothetical protein
MRRHPESAARGPDFPRALPVKLTLEINSLTRRFNLRRNVDLSLHPGRNESSSCIVQNNTFLGSFRQDDAAVTLV